MITSFIRTFIFYIVLIFSMRLMGKRELGDLEPAELVITFLISEIASIPLQDIGIPLINGLIAIILLVCFQLIVSAFSMKSNFFRQLFQGKYSIIITNGKIDQKEMHKLHLTLDELLEELRQKGASSVEEVSLCVLETSGRMSVLLKSDTQISDIPISVVVDGKIIKNNLKKANIDDSDVYDFLEKRNLSLKDVFWLCLTNGEFKLTKKEAME